MIFLLILFSFGVLLFHLLKGGYNLIKGVINIVAPFISKREAIKKTPEYKAFCKNIDEQFNNLPSTKQLS